MIRLAALVAALVWIGGDVVASDEPVTMTEAANVEVTASEEEPALRAVWSVTAIGQYTNTPSPENDNDVGGWFDQYEFTPNKSSDFPFQLGIRDASLDVFREETAVFQGRLSSPTSNLGVSGSEVDDSFFNQRLYALTRLKGIELDLSYRRIRTEQLRLFPNTQGPGLVFDDRSNRDDRFYRDRTGFSSEARLRPHEALDLQRAAGSWLRPELSLRGGYEARDGDEQLRFHRPPSNEWLGLSRDLDRSVGDVGAGLLVAPGGLFTLAFDFDYERLRIDDPVLTDGELGLPPPDTRTIGFTPETDRYTGTVRFNSRLWDRVVVEGGFLVSELEQVSEYTPEQLAAGLRDNSVRRYSVNTSVDVQLLPTLSFNGLFKYDRRENDIERNTPLFNDLTQVDPFVEDWDRFLLAGELELLFWASSRAGFGFRYEDVSRDRDFAAPGGQRILRENTHIDRDTRIVTLYGRTAARPIRRLRVDAELGYRWAPDTGYAMDLDDNLYGELRASYVFAFDRPILLSGYLRGGTGENDDFTQVSGLGPVPNGARLPRHYERSNVVTGLTATASPIDRLTLSVSFFYGRDDQDATLDLSELQRYFQDIAPLDFSREGTSRFENEQTSVVVGLQAELTARTTGGFSYSFTRAKADYSGSDSTALLALVEENHRIDSDTHVLDFELRHQIVAGLEVLAGYRYQEYNDDVSQPESIASVVSPFDRSTHQHTVTVGATLTSAFFQR
jgi:hypothetical protein